MCVQRKKHLPPRCDVELRGVSLGLQLRFNRVKRHDMNGVQILLLLQLLLQRLRQAAFAAGRGTDQAKDKRVGL
jgi:hypothetical protein